MSGGDARGLVKTEVALINHFVHWFQAISANMNAEALFALWKAASSVLTDEWYDEENLNLVKMTQFEVI